MNVRRSGTTTTVGRLITYMNVGRQVLKQTWWRLKDIQKSLSKNSNMSQHETRTEPSFI